MPPPIRWTNNWGPVRVLGVGLMGLGVKTTPPAHPRFEWLQGRVGQLQRMRICLRHCSMRSDRPLVVISSARFHRLRYSCTAGTGEDDLGPLDGARGGHGRPV